MKEIFIKAAGTVNNSLFTVHPLGLSLTLTLLSKVRISNYAECSKPILTVLLLA